MSLGLRPPTVIVWCSHPAPVTASKQAKPSESAVQPEVRLEFARPAMAFLVKPETRVNLIRVSISPIGTEHDSSV